MKKFLSSILLVTSFFLSQSIVANGEIMICHAPMKLSNKLQIDGLKHVFFIATWRSRKVKNDPTQGYDENTNAVGWGPKKFGLDILNNAPVEPSIDFNNRKNSTCESIYTYQWQEKETFEKYWSKVIEAYNYYLDRDVKYSVLGGSDYKKNCGQIAQKVLEYVFPNKRFPFPNINGQDFLANLNRDIENLFTSGTLTFDKVTNTVKSAVGAVAGLTGTDERNQRQINQATGIIIDAAKTINTLLSTPSNK